MRSFNKITSKLFFSLFGFVSICTCLSKKLPKISLGNLKVISATTKVILANTEVITSTLNVILATTKVILGYRGSDHSNLKCYLSHYKSYIGH